MSNRPIGLAAASGGNEASEAMPSDTSSVWNKSNRNSENSWLLRGEPETTIRLQRKCVGDRNDQQKQSTAISSTFRENDHRSMLEGFRILELSGTQRPSRSVKPSGTPSTPAPVTPLEPPSSARMAWARAPSSIPDGFLAARRCGSRWEGRGTACASHGRGGFHRLRTQGHTEPIRFEVYYRQNARARPITYELSVDEERGRPFIAKERLRQRRKGQSRGRPFSFLHLENGRGMAWTGEDALFLIDDEIDDLIGLEESSDREAIELQDTDRLAIATLGALKPHPRISTISPVHRRLVSELLYPRRCEGPATRRPTEASEHARRQSRQCGAVHGT